MSARLALLPLLLLALFTGAPPCSALELELGLEASSSPGFLARSLQLVLVTAPDWDANQGVLQRFQRPSPDADWQPAGGPMPVGLGHSGLGWGRGLHPEDISAGDAPVKQEGDGRAPAGVFELPGAFARDPDELAGAKLPVARTSENLYCVDDAASRHYNRITTPQQAGGKDWNSAETMLRPDGLYRWGVVVAHNYQHPRPGSGSCIFLHLRLKPRGVTSGCTAMAPSDLASLILWLDPSARPVLVQLPDSEYQRLKKEWSLP